MYSLFLVMAGGAVGSGARYLTGRATLEAFGPNYPWGTLAVNLIGGFLMGALVGVLARNDASENWRLLLAVGALGGFTTFSAFSLDTVMMIERGALGTAALYVLVSVIGSITALFAGLMLTRSIFGTVA
ncbi:fluoride efflux transporter CrcB [Sphingomonas sp. PB4P5]|uniref:fluoride efflux transporter CrcB n=1 Tax=Parasphingomonas puruogangriensis TaxID=3096155 RepID=UPI002FCB3640